MYARQKHLLLLLGTLFSFLGFKLIKTSVQIKYAFLLMFSTTRNAI